jgi:cellulose synthase/poly-beta-1,6-N-acetylglucosamine synthase-like glycosyltransferase
MIDARRQRLLAAVVALTAAGIAAPLLESSPHFNAALYFVASSLVSLELIDLAARFWLARRYSSLPAAATHAAVFAQVRVRPYALVLSVRDLLGELDTVLAMLAPYNHRTWIIDDASNDVTPAYLQAMGWRCLASASNRKKPGALKALVAELPNDIATVLVLDPDAVPLDRGWFAVSDVEAAILRFQRSGAAACCPRIRIREDGWLASFQVLECELAFMLGRKGMSPHTITSGVALYERHAVERALAKHSLSVYAEDLENTLLLLSADEEIHYDESLVIETEGKRRLGGWFSQRVGWSYGLMKVLAERRAELVAVAAKSPWTFYNFGVYLALFSVVLVPLKLAGVLLLCASLLNGADELFALGVVPDGPFTDPSYFAATYATYTLLIVLLTAVLRLRLRPTTWLIAVPFYPCYAALQVAPAVLGYLNWLSLRWTGRRVFRDHYTADSELGERRGAFQS